MSGDAIDKPKDKPVETSRVDSALKEMAHKLKVAQYVGSKMMNLAEDIGELSFSEVFDQFKNIFGISFLGALMWKDEFEEEFGQDFEKWKNEPVEGVKVTENVRQVENQEIVASGPRKMLLGEDGKERKHENAGESLKKERFANMAPPTKDDYDVWHEKDGKRVSRGTKGAVKKWAIKANPKHKDPKDRPSEFALKYGSSALFEKTPDSPEELINNVIEKIYPLETDRSKAIEKAANFLSRCALGRFQILPSCHFDKMGWSVKGEEGLVNMYKFIKEPQRQTNVFIKIIEGDLKRYNNDPIPVGISYYSGKAARQYLAEKKMGLLEERYENGKKVIAYKKGVSGKLNYEQRGGGTILSYANNVLQEYERSAGLGYNVFERTAMAVEWIEGTGTSMNKSFANQALSDSAHESIKSAEMFSSAIPKSLNEKEISDTTLKPVIENKTNNAPQKNPEIITETTIDTGMNQFIQEKLKTKEGSKLWAENLEGNGNRTVLTYIPPGVDLKANNLTFIYQFHGTFGEQVTKPYEGLDERKKGWSRLEDTITSVDELAKKGKNVVLVYPLSGGERGIYPKANKDNDAAWMATGKKDHNGKEIKENFDQMHAEILAQTGIKSSQISTIEVQGNSSGGKAMMNIAQSGTKLVNAYRFLDASFRGYAEACYAASRKNGAPDLFLIIANTTHRNFPKNKHKESEWGKKGLLEKGNKGPYSTKIDGLYFYQSDLEHGEMLKNFTGWRPENKIT